MAARIAKTTKKGGISAPKPKKISNLDLVLKKEKESKRINNLDLVLKKERESKKATPRNTPSLAKGTATKSKKLW